MGRSRGVLLAALVLVALLATAAGAGAAPQLAGGDVSADDFDPGLFDESSAILTNEWVSYDVGKRFVWTGWTVDDGERIPHKIVFTVTDLTKVLNGIRARVAWDRDYSAGKLVEQELIFLAQDREGNVWSFGEITEVFDEDGELVGARAWLAGYLDGAKAGIHMVAEPRLGMPAYSQGYAPPPFYWDDWSRVDRVHARTCVPTGCYRNVLVIDEFEPSKPGAHQLKYYARGVGNVRTGWRGKTADHEILTLRKVVQLRPDQIDRARQAVLEIETRAYVYGLTPPAEQWPGPRTG